ncbi:unnamed protein product, partial [Ectocarpus fasciculatus]
SEETHHQLPPPWSAYDIVAAACPGAGEAPATSGGNIGCTTGGCQADSQDEASFQLFAWMGTFLLAYFLGRCARLAWIVFVEIVRTMWEVKMRALPRPPAPVLRDNDMEGGPANVAEPAPGVPVLGDNDVEGAPANLVAPAVFGVGLPLGLGPPAPLPSRSISAPERLISTP